MSIMNTSCFKNEYRWVGGWGKSYRSEVQTEAIKGRLLKRLLDGSSLFIHLRLI